MLGIKLNRGRGNAKEGLVVNFNEFLQRWARGASTLDLVVVEFQSGCGQMDLASAYVLCPLNRLVLDFVAWNRGLVNEQRSGGIPDRRWWRGLWEWGEEPRLLIRDEVANELELRGANLVDIWTGSTVHWTCFYNYGGVCRVASAAWGWVSPRRDYWSLGQGSWEWDLRLEWIRSKGLGTRDWSSGVVLHGV